jgi:hypothetical protein
LGFLAPPGSGGPLWPRGGGGGVGAGGPQVEKKLG